MRSDFEFQNVFGFSEIHKERIGQLINYIALKQKHLYCTRLIKMLYIIDEKAMSKLGMPITWMKYYVFEMGPVPKNLWFSIKDDNKIFGEYFDVIEEGAYYKINAIDQPNMAEFSKREISIIDSVIEEYGGAPVDSLIEYLHRKEHHKTQVRNYVKYLMHLRNWNTTRNF